MRWTGRLKTRVEGKGRLGRRLRDRKKHKDLFRLWKDGAPKHEEDDPDETGSRNVPTEEDQ